MPDEPAPAGASTPAADPAGERVDRLTAQLYPAVFFGVVGYVAAYFLPNAYLALGVMLVLVAPTLVCAARLAMARVDPVSWPVFVAGAALIVGAPAFDLLVSSLRCRDPGREASPIILFLLSRDTPLWMIYLAGYVSRGMLVVINLLLWLALLRNHARLVRLSYRQAPPTASGFLFHALNWMGAGGRYRFTWLLTACWVGSAVTSVRSGLTCLLDDVPSTHVFAVLGLSLSAGVYSWSLLRARARLMARDAAPPRAP